MKKIFLLGILFVFIISIFNQSAVIGKERKQMAGKSIIRVHFLTEKMEPPMDEKKVIYCKFTRTSPIIDGRLDDLCWREATKISNFVLSDQSLAKEQTIAYLVHDGNNLYVAFQCFDSQINRLKAKTTDRDNYLIFADDCVEVFLDTNNDRKDYYHFTTNPIGTRHDEECNLADKNVKWNPQWLVKTSVGEKCWFVEMAIPFKELKPEGDIWGLNLTREYPNTSEWSAWSCTYGGFHNPEKFGEVIMEKELYSIKNIDWGGEIIG